MQVTLPLASSWQKSGRKGEGEYAGKRRTVQAEPSAPNSEFESYHATVESNSSEPHSPSLSIQRAAKGQAAFEYYLVLVLAGVLITLVLVSAAGFSSGERELISGASTAAESFVNSSLAHAAWGGTG